MQSFNPIVMHKNENDATVPITGELKQIINSVVQLENVPHRFQGITAKSEDNTITYTEVYDDTELTSNTFKCNYSNGRLYFHPSQEGKRVKLDYYSVGYFMISTDRIYHDVRDNGNFVSLTEIMDTTEYKLEQLDDAVKHEVFMGEEVVVNPVNLGDINNRLDSVSASLADMVYNVKQPIPPRIAAVGNGISDDTIAINSAIDYINSNGGGIVYLPKGRYLNTGIITKNKVLLVGAGMTNSILVVSGINSVGLRSLGHDNQLAANDASYGSFENLGVEMSDPTHIGVSYIGLSRWKTANVLISATGGKGIVCKPTVLRSAGGCSQWYNDFYSVFVVSNNPSSGVIGMDIGGELNTDEQATTWNFYGGRVNSCAIGIKLNGCNAINFYGMTTEGNTENWIIGQSENRQARHCRIINPYIEGGSNGFKLNATSFRCTIENPYITSLTGISFSDSGSENKYVYNGIQQKYQALGWEWHQTSLNNNPSVIGKRPGFKFVNTDDANNELRMAHGGEYSDDSYHWYIVDQTNSRYLIRAGATGAALFSPNLKLNNSNVGIYVVTGVPAIAAPIGSIAIRTDGTAGATMYVKESGTDTTGWVAK